MVHVAAGAIVPQSVEVAKSPPAVTEEITSAAFPVFVSVNDWVAAERSRVGAVNGVRPKTNLDEK